jgi:hypothetical protein
MVNFPRAASAGCWEATTALAARDGEKVRGGALGERPVSGP